MSLGDRCDEIVKLIDDALGAWALPPRPVSRLPESTDRSEELTPLRRTA